MFYNYLFIFSIFLCLFNSANVSDFETLGCTIS